MSIALTGEKYNPERRTIKKDNLCLVTSTSGQIVTDEQSGYGLYSNDTRFLSRHEIKVNSCSPLMLSSSTEAGHSSIFIGTNPIFKDALDPEKTIDQETVQFKKENVIYDALYEMITINNYNLTPIGIRLDIYFDADFLDIFQIRNIFDGEKATLKEPVYNNGILKFSYTDATGLTMVTSIEFISELPDIVVGGSVRYEFMLYPSIRKEIKYNIKIESFNTETLKHSLTDIYEAYTKINEEDKICLRKSTRFLSDNEDLNEMLQRSHCDLTMLEVKTDFGNYIAAGIPWYTCLFGRDSIIAARQALMLDSSIAKNVLQVLAHYQGKDVNPWRDEEPGKILHELRNGELARSGKIPHTPYYGSVDSTPLWLMLYYDYYRWTNDIKFLESLWKNALNCLEWIDKYSFYNGFVSYSKKSPIGLDNQSWKDSFNSNIHDTGELAEPPIAPIEAQGYVYAARIRMAELAEVMGQPFLKAKLLQDAKLLKEAFHKAFWMDDHQYYAMALDKNGRQLKVITSNPGHCLETGIIPDEYINIVAERLMADDMYSGWGIRTLSKNSIAYNPISYHNGSVWPHDNSIIAYGMTKIGRIDLALRILTGLFESARLIRYKRLPELFCGFSRKYLRIDPPVLYPVACTPQAWSASSIFFLIQSVLNIDPDSQNNELKLYNSVLPYWLTYLRINDLKIGEASVDLEFRRTAKTIVLDILDRRGKLDIILKK